jgi:hypothetical protein
LRQIEQQAANCEPVGAMTVGEETVMPDAVETARRVERERIRPCGRSPLAVTRLISNLSQ